MCKNISRGSDFYRSVEEFFVPITQPHVRLEFLTLLRDNVEIFGVIQLSNFFQRKPKIKMSKIVFGFRTGFEPATYRVSNFLHVRGGIGFYIRDACLFCVYHFHHLNLNI